MKIPLAGPAALAVAISLVLAASAHRPAGVLPDPSLTPGAVRTTDSSEVCATNETRQFRHWTRQRDDRILAEYALPAGPHPTYEIDHLVPLDLGGADTDANLWPQPRANIVAWRFSAEAKDRLEWRAHDLVCAGLIDLKTIQHEIATNWLAAYRKYMSD